MGISQECASGQTTSTSPHRKTSLWSPELGPGGGVTEVGESARRLDEGKKTQKKHFRFAMFCSGLSCRSCFVPRVPELNLATRSVSRPTHDWKVSFVIRHSSSSHLLDSSAASHVRSMMNQGFLSRPCNVNATLFFLTRYHPPS
ncbi:hypothetical protein CGRA01v4_11713 [Colletotrichum graminicola]|nr:hypothetical protein CGRA01v4_11713 [Colletotrichum graminicola]